MASTGVIYRQPVVFASFLTFHVLKLRVAAIQAVLESASCVVFAYAHYLGALVVLAARAPQMEFAGVDFALAKYRVRQRMLLSF